MDFLLTVLAAAEPAPTGFWVDFWRVVGWIVGGLLLLLFLAGLATVVDGGSGGSGFGGHRPGGD